MIGVVVFVARKDLWFARGRFALVGLVIGLVALMATLLSGLANGLVDDGVSGLRQLPASHLAFQPGAESTFSRSTLTREALEPWDELDGVESAPIGMSFFNARRDDGTTIDLAVFGAPAESFLAAAIGGLDDAASAPGLIVSDTYEDVLTVGDVVTIVGLDQEIPIVGFASLGSYGHVDVAFTSLTTWQSLLYGDNAADRFSAIAVRSDDLEAVSSAATTSGTELETRESAFRGSPGYTGETQTMSMMRTFLLLISALVVGAFFTVWTVQRNSEIGLLKALGASTFYVIKDAIGQMVAVLLAASTIGALMGVGLGSLVGSSVPFRLEAAPVISSIALLVAFGVIGCLVALRRIVSVDPIIALRART
ncbi:putative ABC transport system permease protein [Ilumatobacter fluminis]|uniref:Putative ABC transport system permease protein n=1 Tax=Ilumatobacter fluminis TaxID=467091 RepID=A0A4R7I2N5_9ACTN|nr:ABC transporter permease [Ilumatobacter fluminis]TDT17149.1 putative ABC transport system permease protein [Ilumatobacter fluminis]